MGKETYSFSLEEDINNKINKVKNDLKLSSRSAALERIILTYGNNSGIDKEDLKDLIREVILESKSQINEPKKNEPQSIIKASIRGSLDTMPDN